MYRFILFSIIGCFLFICGELVISDHLAARSNYKSTDKNVAFISDLEYGLFSHYVWSGGGGTVDQNGIPSKSIREQLNTFDVQHDLHDFTPADKARFDYKFKGDTTFNFDKWNQYLSEMYLEIAYRFEGKMAKNLLQPDW